MKRIYLVLIFSGFASIGWGAASSTDYFKAGCQLYSQKQFEVASRYLKAAVQLEPNYWQAYQVLGQAYYQQGDRPDALTAFETSLKIHPDNQTLQNFVDRLNQNNPVENSVSGSRPVSSLGVNVKSMASFDAKNNHLFVNVLDENYLLFNSSLSNADTAWNSYLHANSLSGLDSSSLQTASFGLELGYVLDRENALSLLFSYGPYGQLDVSNYPSGSIESSSQNINVFFDSFSPRYYRYLPDSLGRWFGFVGPDVCIFNCQYSTNVGGDTSNNAQWVRALSMGSIGIGGTLGVGRQLDIFGFLGIEASLAFKVMSSGQITGPYNDLVGASGGTSIATGQGTLVTLSNGSIVLVDQKNVGSAKYTTFDLTGLEGRLGINIWL